MAASRQRTSGNKGEQALLVLRQSGCLWMEMMYHTAGEGYKKAVADAV